MRPSRRPESQPRLARQRGAVLLVILAVIGIGVAVLFVTGLLRATSRIENDKQTADALAKAKDALIGYAATYRDRNANNVFGYLPCPDLGRGGVGNEGVEDSVGCIGGGNQDMSVVGRLPWKTLGLPPLRDGHGECLWYAVSGSFKSKTKTDLMGWDTNGQFEIFLPDGATQLAGTTPTNRAVAVIFSAGAPLAGQNRAPDPNITAPECGGNMDAANYLDSAPVGGTTFTNYLANTVGAAAHVVDAAVNQVKQFISGDVKDVNNNIVINDRLLFIIPDEIFAKKVVKRSDFRPLLTDSATGMLYRTAECIARYGLTVNAATKRLPWAAPVNMDALSATKYGTNANYSATANLRTGRTPYQADATNIHWLDVVNNTDCPNFDANAFAWWQNYKDQLFYAVADAFKPGTGAASCSNPATCLTVDGIGPYAAVVIFSGQKLAGQNRNTNNDYTSADKATLSNYLEGNNLTAMAAAGNGNFTKGSFSSTSNNDVLVCINPDLTIDATCVNPVGGSSGSGGGGVYTGLVPPTVSQNPGWTGNTGLSSVTLSDGTVISVTASGNASIYVSNTGIGVDSGSGAKSLNLGNGEQMIFTFPSGNNSLAILVGMLKNNDTGYIQFKSGGVVVGSATLNGCSSSNPSIFNNIVPAGNPTFDQVVLTSGTSNGYYVNQVSACAGASCSITGAGTTGASTCTSWTSP